MSTRLNKPFLCKSTLYPRYELRSSDLIFTPWGEREQEIFYDYTHKRGVVTPEECGRYSALFDEQHNITKSEYYYTQKRINYDKKNPKNREEIIENKVDERTFDNSYDDNKTLIRRKEIRTFGTNGEEHTYTTIYEYDRNGKLIKTIQDDRDLMLFDYQGDLLTSKERYYIRHHHNLFESGESLEEGYIEEYKYNSEGNRILTTCMDVNGNNIDTESIEYESIGISSRKTIRNSNGITRISCRPGIRYSIFIGKNYFCDKLIRYRSTILDEMDNITKETVYSKTYTYNKRKKILQRDNSISTFSFEYTYDEYGNWTRKDFYFENAHYYVTRDIEYYK